MRRTIAPAVVPDGLNVMDREGEVPESSSAGTAAAAGRPRWSQLLRGVALLGGLALVVLAALLASARPRPAAGPLRSIGADRGGLAAEAVGQPAPDFTLSLFDGGTFRLAGQRRQSVVLNFWASWCVPCRAEMPAFETTYRANQGRGVVFVGAAVNDDPEASRAFLKELGITYPAGPDDGNPISLRYQVYGLPTTVFIMRDGKVARKRTGQMTQHELEGYVNEIAR